MFRTLHVLRVQSVKAVLIFVPSQRERRRAVTLMTRRHSDGRMGRAKVKNSTHGVKPAVIGSLPRLIEILTVLGEEFIFIKS